MNGRVRLQQGDMFSGPTDLIVLPCSTAGTVAPIVKAKLSTLDLDYPCRSMKLGTVELVPSEHAEHIAQYIAYAASVDKMRSSTRAISNIGLRLAQLTKKHELIRRISAPLLGAGAGSLSPEESARALAEGFRATAVSDAILTIYVFQEHDVASLARSFESQLPSLSVRDTQRTTYNQAQNHARQGCSSAMLRMIARTRDGSSGWRQSSAQMGLNLVLTSGTCEAEWTYHSGCATNSCRAIKLLLSATRPTRIRLMGDKAELAGKQ